MNKAILVTGTPGTGKTEIAKLIAEHYGYEYIHIGDNDEYIIDKEESVKVIDIKKMIKYLEKKQEETNKTLIIESHLSHYYPKEKTQMCIILRCDPSELKNRLAQRGYNEMKIKINLEAEAMDLILQEAINEGHKIYEIDTTHKTSAISSQEAIKAIRTNETRHGIVNYTYYLTNPKNLITTTPKSLRNKK